MILSTLLLASPFLIQEPAAPIPITHQGEAASEAFFAWANGLPKELVYPVQTTMQMEMAFDQPEEDMRFEVRLDMTSYSEKADSVQVWGNIEAQGDAEYLKFDWSGDVNFGIGDYGFRMVFHEDGQLAELAEMAIPEGYSLSSDRLEILGDLYMEMLEATPSYSEETFEAAFGQMTGPGDFMHPGNWLLNIEETMGDIEVDAWGVKDGRVRVDFNFDSEELWAQLKEMDAGLDPRILQELELDLVFSEKTGQWLYCRLALESPILMPSGDPGVNEEVNIKFAMVLNNVPVSLDIPELVLASEKTMDLNPYFDQYLPMIKAGMQMAIEQANKSQGEREAAEDFEF